MHPTPNRRTSNGERENRLLSRFLTCVVTVQISAVGRAIMRSSPVVSGFDPFPQMPPAYWRRGSPCAFLCRREFRPLVVRAWYKNRLTMSRFLKHTGCKGRSGSDGLDLVTSKPNSSAYSGYPDLSDCQGTKDRGSYLSRASHARSPYCVKNYHNAPPCRANCAGCSRP